MKSILLKASMSLFLLASICFSFQTTVPTSQASSTSNAYTVKKGDTLSRIAKSHHMTVKELKSLNGLKTDKIYVGQKLKVKKTTNRYTEADYNRMIDSNKNLTSRDKRNIKNSQIVRYLVHTYIDEIEVKEFSIYYLGKDKGYYHYDNHIKVSVTEKNKDTKYTISCGYGVQERGNDEERPELNQATCEYVSDGYIHNLISTSARKEIEPHFNEVFKKNNIQLYVYAEYSRETAQQIQSNKDKWDYPQWKDTGKIKLVNYILLKDERKSYEDILKFIKNENKNLIHNKNVNNSLFFLYSGNDKKSLKSFWLGSNGEKINSVEEIKKKTIPSTYEFFQQNISYLPGQINLYK